MYVTVSSSFPAAVRPEIEAVVRAGFEGVEAHDVEVHVKARGTVRRSYHAEFELRLRDLVSREARAGASRARLRRLRDYADERGVVRVRERHRRKRDAEQAARRHGGTVVVETRRAPSAGGWSGRTYHGVPGLASVQPGTAYLVTMNIPRDPRRLTRYPTTYRYPGLKTAPVVELASWQEELFHLAAHEARHVEQFRNGWKRSEIDAERRAADRLASWAGRAV